MIITGIFAGALFYVSLAILYTRLPEIVKRFFKQFPLIGDIVITVFVFKTTTAISSSVTGFIAAVVTDVLVALTMWLQEHTFSELYEKLTNKTK